MNKKIISKYDKCSHILVCTNAYEKDNDVIYRYACPKCMLDERVLDIPLDVLSNEHLKQRDYILNHNNNIPGIYISKYCSDLNELNKSYKEFINTRNYNYKEEAIIDEIKKQIKIMDTMNYIKTRANEEYEKLKEEHYNYYDNCCHLKVVTGISQKTNEIRYGCIKCMLDERFLDYSRESLDGFQQIIYDYLATGSLKKYGRNINLYDPYLGELHIYYKKLNVPNTYKGYQDAEEAITNHILIKTRRQDKLFRK